MWHHGAPERSDILEEHIASIMRVKRISELGTTLAATSNQLLLTLYLTHWFFSPWWWRWYTPPKHWFSQEQCNVTSQKTAFFIVTTVKTPNLTQEEKRSVQRILSTCFRNFWCCGDAVYGRTRSGVLPALSGRGWQEVHACVEVTRIRRYISDMNLTNWYSFSDTFHQSSTQKHNREIFISVLFGSYINLLYWQRNTFAFK
jgi:hypothetical protein